ncbi:MAG: serine acetyltransferase [Gammaproteobacteria bacterium]|nr:serine acetyltransferase [Gammaproteobacteria bacterium]
MQNSLSGFDALRIDLRRKRRHYTRIDNFVNKYIKMTLQWGSLAVMVYRCEQQISKLDIPVLSFLLLALFRLLSAPVKLATDCRINPQAEIDKGLVLHNFAGIELDPRRVGTNLTVNQNVCIGADYYKRGKPVLGNNVFVGAGAKILGDIEIGNNVVIAANSVVISSIPDNCSVVGIPAKIVSRGVTSDYLSFDVE